MHCRPPRCAKAKQRCQCPNSWLEYLSKTARERQEKSLPRLSLKQHASNYGVLRRSGTFKKLEKTSSWRECGDIDTEKLCGWNKERQHLVKGTAQFPPKQWRANFLNLRDKSIKNFPDEPRIKTADYDGIPVIIKIEEIQNALDYKDFLYTTKVHLMMSEKIPEAVPSLYKAYFLEDDRNNPLGVHIMERLDGVSLEKYLRGERPNFLSAAKAVKALIDQLDSCNVLHHDLGPHNAIVDVDSNGLVRSARAVDMEDTRLLETVQGLRYNPYMMFSHPGDDSPAGKRLENRLRQLNEAYLKLDPSLPRDMGQWEEERFDEYIDSSPKRRYTDLPRLPKIRRKV